MYPKEQINKYARKDKGEKRAEVLEGDRGDKFNIKSITRQHLTTKLMA